MMKRNEDPKASQSDLAMQLTPEPDQSQASDRQEPELDMDEVNFEKELNEGPELDALDDFDFDDDNIDDEASDENPLGLSVEGSIKKADSDDAAEEPAAATDLSDPVAEQPWFMSVTEETIEKYEPAQVVEFLSAAVVATDVPIKSIELCCKRLRVLCREADNCKRCDEAGTAKAVVSAMTALSLKPSVQLQALAASRLLAKLTHTRTPPPLPCYSPR